MSAGSVLIDNNDLVERVQVAKQRILLKCEAAYAACKGIPYGSRDFDYAQAMVDIYAECVELLDTVERTLVIGVEEVPPPEALPRMVSSMEAATRKIAYSLPTARQLGRCPESLDSRIRIAQIETMVSEHVEVCEELGHMIDDVRKVFRAFRREIEDEEGGQSSQAASPAREGKTVLNVVELAGVLGVSERAVTDAVVSKEMVAGRDVWSWFYDAGAETKFFVPNDVLRQEGAEKLIGSGA